jgi:hypothetical protein
MNCFARWTEVGETWRVLCAHFPGTIATHGTIQDLFFGHDPRLRRDDYSMDVASGFNRTHLVHNCIEVDDIRLPTRQWAYLRGPDERPAPYPMMVSVDISNVWFC